MKCTTLYVAPREDGRVLYDMTRGGGEGGSAQCTIHSFHKLLNNSRLSAPSTETPYFGRWSWSDTLEKEPVLRDNRIAFVQTNSLTRRHVTRDGCQLPLHMLVAPPKLQNNHCLLNLKVLYDKREGNMAGELRF